MPTGYVLSKEDRDCLARIVEKDRNNPIRERSAPPPPQDLPAPDVYVAIPVTSVTARSGSTLGFGDCYIYRITEDTADIELIDGLQKTVYNLTTDAISTPFLAIREKWGLWVAAPGGSGGSGQTTTQAIAVSGSCNPPAASFATMTFGSVDVDTDGYWNGGTPKRLTVPAGFGGTFLITGFMRGQFAADSLEQNIGMGFPLSGSGLETSMGTISGSSRKGTYNGSYFTITSALWKTLADGDYVEMNIVNDTGGNALTADNGKMGLFRMK